MKVHFTTIVRAFASTNRTNLVPCPSSPSTRVVHPSAVLSILSWCTNPRARTTPGGAYSVVTDLALYDVKHQ